MIQIGIAHENHERDDLRPGDYVDTEAGPVDRDHPIARALAASRAEISRLRVP